MESLGKPTSALGRCLSIVAGWVIFSLAFGLLHWADEKTGLTYQAITAYLSLAQFSWPVDSYLSINIADWIVRSFVCAPAILIGLTFYEYCTAGIPTFSIRSVLGATTFVAALLAIGAAAPESPPPRWLAIVALAFVIVTSSSYLTWSLISTHRPTGPLGP